MYRPIALFTFKGSSLMEDLIETATQNDFLLSPGSPTKQKAKIIQAIKKNDVHQICSGQVVLNLAIAVKELVENGLDAGATCIEIRLKEYGREFVKVIDNGCGVEEANFQGLTLKHHTSKLQDFSDLLSVSTFGFRGEALSSLCAMSNMTVETRHVDAASGTKLCFDRDGKIVSSTSCPRQVGTSVCIANLFSSLPVRQKEFHRNLKREFSKMTQLLYAYCLVATNVKITCTNQVGKAGSTTVAATQGSRSVRENIGCVFGSKQAQALLDMPQPEHDTRFTLEGYVSSASHGHGRGAPDRQFFFVNSRPCEPIKLMKAVNEVYHTFNANQHPFVFLNVTVQRADVDVNVTPDKRQVFFDNEKQLLAIVKGSLSKLFEDNLSTFQFQNASLHLQISLPPSPATPAVATPKESKLAAMISEWKRQSSDSPLQGFKRTIEREQYNDSPGKKPCILDFFKRQSKPASAETNGLNTEDLCKDTCDRLDLTYDRNINCDEDVPSVNEDMMHTDSFSEACSEIESSPSDNIILQDNTAADALPTISTISGSSSADDSFTNNDVEIIRDDNSVTSNGSNQSGQQEPENVTEWSLIDNGLHVSENSVLDDTINEQIVVCSVASESVSEAMLVDSDIQTAEVNVCDADDDRPTDFKRRSVWLPFTLDTIVERLKKRKAKHEVPTVVRFRAAIDPSKNKSAEQELGREIEKHMFKEMSIVGQFNLGFIITRLGSDLFIVDQHASDEKYNFETLQLTQTLSNQRLVFPISLELCAVSENTLLENMHIFKTNGFDFVIDSTAEATKRVKLTAIPVSRNWQFGKEDVDELLFMLQDAPGTMCRPSRVRAMFASRACRKSVMIGSALSQSDMRRLVDHMGTIEQPWNCPHGRPTMRHLINLDLLHSAETI